jgi:iron complex transport system substrate-binding protein
MHFLKTGKNPFPCSSKRVSTLIISFGFLLFSGQPTLGGQLIDATQTQVRLNDHPQRIVTLAPSLGELVTDLLGKDLGRLVGVSEYTDYPTALRKLPSIGPYHHFNLEKVLALKPDLVLATLDGNSKEQVNHLRELKVPVVVVETGNFTEIAGSMKLVAKALGVPNLGAEMASQLTLGIQRVKLNSKNHSPLKVLLQIGEDPMVLVGGNSFLHSALETIGAINVYRDAKIPYPRPSLEDVLKRDPDVIVIIALGGELKQFDSMAKKWGQFRSLKAVKDGRVHVLRSDSLLRPTLRILEGLARLERTVYGKN